MGNDIQNLFGGKATTSVDKPAKRAQPRVSDAQVESLHRKLFDNWVTLDVLMAGLKGAWSRGTVYNWLSRDEVPESCARKIRGKCFFNPTEFALWLQRSGR